MEDFHKSLAEELIPPLSAILAKNHHSPDEVDFLTAEVRHIVEAVLRRTRNANGSTETPQKMTPPKLAKLWGVSPDKILTWIRSGELRAVNVATDSNSRPRYLIDQRAIEQFEATRLVEPVHRTTRRKSNRDDWPSPL
jgi:hypothetical protein